MRISYWNSYVCSSDRLDSRGAHLFQRVADNGGLKWKVPYSDADPVHTPHTLDTADPEVLQALGMAVKSLNEDGIAFDAPLRELQFAKRPDGPIPVHGGSGQLGVFNVIGPVMSDDITAGRSEEHTSELQSLMRT